MKQIRSDSFIFVYPLFQSLVTINEESYYDKSVSCNNIFGMPFEIRNLRPVSGQISSPSSTSYSNRTLCIFLETHHLLEFFPAMFHSNQAKYNKITNS